MACFWKHRENVEPQAIRFPRVHTEPLILAAIAGVIRKLECTRQKLYHAKYTHRAAIKFSNFFENAFVSRV